MYGFYLLIVCNVFVTYVCTYLVYLGVRVYFYCLEMCTVLHTVSAQCYFYPTMFLAIFICPVIVVNECQNQPPIISDKICPVTAVNECINQPSHI